MSVLEDLISLRDELSGCETVAYSDLSQKMILCVASRRSHRQEVLDALCQTASASLGATTGGLLNKKLSDVAVFATEGLTEVFVRSPSVTSDALCLVCSPGIDLSVAIDKARSALERIAD